MAILFYKITGPSLSHDSLPVFGMKKRGEKGEQGDERTQQHRRS